MFENIRDYERNITGQKEYFITWISATVSIYYTCSVHEGKIIQQFYVAKKLD
jgi:hypothetical protein